MAISPIDYTIGNGFGEGIGLAGLYQENKQRKVLAEQQQQQLEVEKAFQTDWQDAWSSGDQKKLLNLSGKYPNQMKTIRDGMGIRDEQHQKSVNDMANDLAVARQVGTPQAMAQAISKHPEALKSIGATPEEAMQLSLSDPSQFDNLVNAVRLSTMPASEQFGVQDKKEGRVIERDKLTEDARKADMDNARGIRGQNLGYQSSALDRAQRAQFHMDNMSANLIKLSQEQAESGKIDPKLVQSINKDIDSFGKNYSAMHGAAKSLEALGDRNTPASQLGMIFNYMKSLDPQSVVREGEQVQVKRTDGIFGTMGNYVTQLSNGKMLNDEQVKDLIGTSKVLSNTEGEKFNQTMDDYFTTYGDSLPNPLVKRFDSRKAKLFEMPKESPQQPQKPQPAPKQKLTIEDEELLNKYL